MAPLIIYLFINDTHTSLIEKLWAGSIVRISFIFQGNPFFVITASSSSNRGTGDLIFPLNFELSNGLYRVMHDLGDWSIWSGRVGERGRIWQPCDLSLARLSGVLTLRPVNAGLCIELKRRGDMCSVNWIFALFWTDLDRSISPHNLLRYFTDRLRASMYLSTRDIWRYF